MGKKNATARATATRREITVLVRYFIKATRNVVLYVESDQGQRYYVSLQRNGRHSCSCPARGSCYHIERAREMENKRLEQRLNHQLDQRQEQAPEKAVQRDFKPLASRDLGATGALHSHKPFSLDRAS